MSAHMAEVHECVLAAARRLLTATSLAEGTTRMPEDIMPEGRRQISWLSLPRISIMLLETSAAEPVSIQKCSNGKLA